MSETTPPPKKRGLLKKLGLVAGILFVLLVVLYFVVTSGAFFKGVILPKVARAMNADVTVSDASISPFSQVVLRDFKVRTTGTEPLLAVSEVRARYSLFAILGGNFKVEEVTLTSPVVQLIENADGTSNLDPITKSSKSDVNKAEPSATGKPPQIDIRKVALKNAAVRIIKNHAGGTRDVTELSNVNVTLDDLKNARTGKLTLAADLKIDQNPPAPGTNASVQATLAGNFTFDLSADLKPGAVKGHAKFEVARAGGAFTELTSFAATLDCDASPVEIKQLALRFQKAGANLGELQVSGPFDAARSEGSLKVEILNIDKQVLNLAGASSGLDFGPTTIRSTNQFNLTKAGDVITVVGQLEIARFSVTQKGQTTPALDLQAAYNVTANTKDKTALVQAFTINGTQNQRPLLLTRLASPMNLAWGENATTTGDSTLNLTLTNLNLADWKPFTDNTVSAGTVDATLNLISKQAGKQLALELASQLSGLNAMVGSNSIQQAGLTMVVRGQATEFKKINLSEFRLQFTHLGQPMAAVTASGTVDAGTKDADLQVMLEAAPARLFAALPQPGLSATAGFLGLAAHVVRKGETQTATGNFALTNFTGRSGEYQLAGFTTTADLDVAMQGDQLSLRKLSGALREGVNPGGAFDVSGNYDLAKKSGQFALKLVDLNQNALRPFLAPSLGDKKLVSISINTTSSAKLNGADDLALQSDLAVSKLIVSDPKNSLPATPLAVQFQLDATMRQQILDLRKAQIALTPTARATNLAVITGQVDMTRTNAIQGALKLAAESLDVTPYYDLFAGKTPAAATPTPTTPAPGTSAPPTPRDPGAEPAPVTLPFQNFTADLNIGRFYLREVAITNWQTGVKLDGSHVTVNPCRFTLNGAPVQATAALNLGVPGYEYDITFGADKVPVEPLANSFSPEYRGQAKGELLASAQIKGAGTSDASLRKNLSGRLDFTFTNAIIVVGPKAKRLITPIALALRIPELNQSPINWLNTAVRMGEGKINLTQFKLESGAFTADTAGEIPMAAVLTNSPLNNLPVNFSLRRSIAAGAHLIPDGTPTNAAYVKLPTFITLRGTLGDAKTHTDMLVIGGLLAKSASGIKGLGGEKAGRLLDNVGDLLTGEKSSNTNNPANTNKAGAKPGLLDFLNKPKK